MRYCPEASASLLPSDIINDCAVEVHVYKINGRRVCTLVANGKFIGGDVKEFIFHETRYNGMWWISEEQMSDIVFRKGFPVEIFLQQVGKNKSPEGLGIWHERAGPPEPRACVNLSAATTSRVSAARTVTRVEEIEDESDGEAAAAVDSEDERAEQAVLMKRHRANVKEIDNWESSRAFAPELKIKVNAYVRVWSRIFRLTSEGMEQGASEQLAAERCFCRTPYGKKYAVRILGRDPEFYPMPLFLREDQVALANHIYAAERANEAEEHAESWSEAVHIEVEERWLARWRDPEGHAAALEHMDILAGKESGQESSAVQPFRRHAEEEDEMDRGSSADGPRRSAVRKRKGSWAQLLPQEIDNNRSVGYAENQSAVLNFSSFYSKFSKSVVPVFPAQLLDRNSIALLASSSTLDVLGLIHERTGHLNKRAIIECVKSKLVRGLEIEDRHIRKY